MSANGAFTVSNQVDGSAGAVNTAVTGYFGASDTDASDLTSVSSIDIGTRAGASAAIDVIDGALRQIANQRANLGAISNRLDSTVKNLTNISTNLEAGRGRIEDADFAAETTNLAKSQILQQASMAMLAQANASKQGVLSLLQR
jgi:flagellin